MSEPARKIILERSEIQAAVAKVAGEITHWLRSGSIGSLNLISVLEGARPFTRDLIQNLRKNLPQVEFKLQEITVHGTEGKELLDKREWSGLGLDRLGLTQHPVLILDDLVDSGKTLESLRKGILSLGAPEVRTAVLIRKFGPQSGPVDFCGFDLKLEREEMARRGLKDYWLFGYGMDEDGRYRELDHVGWIEVR